jgi:hypothetical protein
MATPAQNRTATTLPKGGVPNAANAAAAAPQAAPAPTPVVAANPITNTLYTLQGAKAYNVRPNTAQNNAQSWQAIQACIQANGGQATHAQLLAAVSPFNHAPMVGYCIRRGWVAPVATTAPAK